MATSTLQFNAPVAASSASLSDYATAFVDSLSGTAHQIIASASAGAVALSTPQNIDTSSTPTFAGEHITGADALTVNSEIVPTRFNIEGHGILAVECVSRALFIADRAYQVVAVSEIHATAEATAGALKLQITKDTSTNAPGAGHLLLTNNSNTGFDLKATINTVQTGGLTATTADLQLAVGDRLSMKFSTAATELSGLAVAVTLKPI